MADTTTSSTATKNTNNENTLAAVAYILTWVTGLIVFLTSKPGEKYKRWHAIQAIGLGIAITVLYILLNVLLFPLMFSSPGSAATLGLLGMLLWLVFLAAIIIMAVTAYQGKKIRLPIIAGMADKHA